MLEAGEGHGPRKEFFSLAGLDMCGQVRPGHVCSNGVWACVFKWGLGLCVQMGSGLVCSNGVWACVFKWGLGMCVQMGSGLVCSIGVWPWAGACVLNVDAWTASAHSSHSPGSCSLALSVQECQHALIASVDWHTLIEA